MKNTIKAADFKRTKILATIGPASDSYKMIKTLLDNGANGIRLNFSHGQPDEKAMQVELVRKASKELQKPVAVVQDLQGPKIRLGDFEGQVTIRSGESFELKYKSTYPEETALPIQFDISKRVAKGHTILLNDGKVVASVDGVKNSTVKLTARTNGTLSKRKGVNLPDTNFSGEIITKKDIKDIAFGAEIGVDYVAMSFVQSAEDIKSLRKILKSAESEAKIIAKIETKMAVKNLEEIILESDAVMVARGDLALEVETEAVPIIQRRIVNLALEHKKISIVATQMLASMTDTTEPSRAEVSDVATAVLMGADAVMLSEETANGNYPAQSVTMMKKIITYAQKNSELDKMDIPSRDNVSDSIALAIIRLAKQVHASAIVAETKSGATALAIASRRPSVLIAAVTSDKKVYQQLALLYGSKTYLRPASRHAAKRITDFLVEEKVLSKGDIIVSASGQQPGISGTTDTIKVRKV